MEIPSEPERVRVRQEYRFLKITSELRAESMYRQKKAGRKQVGTDGVPPLEGDAYGSMSLQVVYKRAAGSVLKTGRSFLYSGKVPDCKRLRGEYAAAGQNSYL